MDDDLFNKICCDIGTGLSVHKACLKHSAKFQDFYPLLSRDDLAEKYARAREARSDVRVDAMDDLMDEIKSGAVDPNAGRVLMDGIKWMAGKEKPKKYGDKPNTEVTINNHDNRTLTVNEAFLRTLTNDQLQALAKMTGAADIKQPLTIDISATTPLPDA